LLSKAIGEGADIKWDSLLVDMSVGQNPCIVKFRNGNASGRIIVGADGVFSKTASIIGLPQQRFAACSQYHIIDIQPIPPNM